MHSRDMIVDIAKGFIGAVQGDAKHKYIVDTYNGYVTAEKNKKHKGSSYKVKYSDAWCATFVSACAILAKCEDIIPTECSCTRQIQLFENIGCYEHNDNYIPKKADIIYYKWDVKSEAENVEGQANHVGIVEYCDGKNITVIEGNYNSRCQRRQIKVGWKYIHGYALPKYDMDEEESKDAPAFYVVKKGDSLSKIAKMMNTTVDNIMSLNPQIKNKNLIYVGQEIRIR